MPVLFSLLRMRHTALLLVTRSVVVAFGAAVLASCTPEATTGPTPDITQVSFAPALGINIAAMTKTASGSYYQDVINGSGLTAGTGNHLTVNYTGYLTNGAIFDTSVGKAPFVFYLGQGQVIHGWDEALVGMRVGGTRKLVVPPSQGYGSAEVGSIPANSILVFTVTLVSIP